MKAAVTNEQHGFDVLDVPDPAPGPGELVIRVSGCGVCGSDVKAQPYMPPGIVMGHEFGGQVVAVGSDVSDWYEEGIAAVLPVLSCGSCQYCVAGAVAHCAETRYLGMGPDGGGFAEFALVPARHAFRLPDGMAPEFAALVEPFAVGLHGVNSARLVPGEDVLVVGAGGVGLTTLAWVLGKGDGRVTVADPDPDRRDAALAMGASDVLPSAQHAEAGAYDVALECVGRPELVQSCQAALHPHGRIVISGACAEPTTIEPITALLKEISIRYSVCYTPDEFREVIEAFAAGEVDPAPLIGPAVGLHDVGKALELVRNGGAYGRVRVMPGAPD